MKKIRQIVNGYTTIFDPNEDGGYTVTVPALPGLVTEGDNLKQAREMAKDAVQCYIESLVIDSMPLPPDQPIIKRRSDIIVGKIVISPQTYKARGAAPVGISDPKLFLKLYLIKKCLDVLFDEKSRKKDRIKNLKDLLTLCDPDLRQLIVLEIVRQLKIPTIRGSKVTEAAIRKGRIEIKKGRYVTLDELLAGDDTILTPEEAKRIREGEAELRAGKGIPLEEVKRRPRQASIRSASRAQP